MPIVARFLVGCMVGAMLTDGISRVDALKSYLAFANGDQMPTIGLGTWKSEPNEVKQAVKTAIQMGYRHIDCAAIYGNEREVGEAIVECLAENIVERKDLWVTSKLWNDSHDPQHVIPALKQTLADLQLEYLDLYLIHWPVALKHGSGMAETADDFLTIDEVGGEAPISATWSAMEEAVDRGLAKHIGVSNFSAKKLESLLKVARIQPEVNQVERHPYLQQRDLAAFAKKHGIHITNYSSLGSGDRPDVLKANDEPVLLKDPVIIDIANKRNTTPAGVLLKWGLAEGASVLPKSVKPDRIKQNLAVNEDVQLDENDMERIRNLDKQRRYVDGTFWCFEGSPYTLENLWDEQEAEVPANQYQQANAEL